MDIGSAAMAYTPFCDNNKEMDEYRWGLGLASVGVQASRRPGIHACLQTCFQSCCCMTPIAANRSAALHQLLACSPSPEPEHDSACPCSSPSSRRFWKGGFWKDHLRGKPYHISALYLIDLHRFRQLAAGDQYRVIYEQLSKDPNSLANLDQDLPNYAQHNIRWGNTRGGLCGLLHVLARLAGVMLLVYAAALAWL